jgi:hypothetical protein
VFCWSDRFPDYETRMKAIADAYQWWVSNTDRCNLSLVPINK